MPIGFQAGPFFIRYYAIIIMIGVMAAAWLASREARRRGQNPEFVLDGLVWVVIGGIIGARIWHILTPPPSMAAMGINSVLDYLKKPLDMLAIWEGGLGIPGAIIGGVVALYFFCRRNKLDTLLWLDIAAPALALGQAIGRWGNFVNQELYGKPTNLPWALPIYNQNKELIGHFHPLFLYESIWNLLNMFFLLWLGRRYEDRLKEGDIFLTYLIVYPVGRFLLEFLRLDAPQVAGLNINQAVMAVVALTAGGVLIWRHRSPNATQQSEKETMQIEAEGNDPHAEPE